MEENNFDGTDLKIQIDKCKKETERYHDINKRTIRKLSKENKMKNYIIIILICLGFLSNILISSAFIYKDLKILEDFEVEVSDEITTTYEQQSDGNSSIVNGNQYKDNSLHQESKDN